MYITVEDTMGQRTLLHVDDWGHQSLMQALRDHAYPIPGICDGMGICGSCHVRILKGAEKIPAASEEEISLLETMAEYYEDSRLACQIRLQTNLNGIIIKLIRK